MNYQDIDFTRAGELTASPETVGRLVSLLTAARTTNASASLIDIEDLVDLIADAEHALAALFFLVGIVVTVTEDLEEREDFNVDRWLQTIALRYQ